MAIIPQHHIKACKLVSVSRPTFGNLLTHLHTVVTQKILHFLPHFLSLIFIHSNN